VKIGCAVVATVTGPELLLHGVDAAITNGVVGADALGEAYLNGFWEYSSRQLVSAFEMTYEVAEGVAATGAAIEASIVAAAR